MRLFVFVVFFLSNLSCNTNQSTALKDLQSETTEDRDLFYISDRLAEVIDTFDGTCVEWAASQIDVYLGIVNRFGVSAEYYKDLMDRLGYLYGFGGGTPYLSLELYYNSMGYDIDYINLNTCIDYAVIADKMNSGCEAVVFMMNPMTDSHVESIVSVILSDVGLDKVPQTCSFISNSWGSKETIRGFSGYNYYHSYFIGYNNPRTEAHVMTICPSN